MNRKNSSKQQRMLNILRERKFYKEQPIKKSWFKEHGGCSILVTTLIAMVSIFYGNYLSKQQSVFEDAKLIQKELSNMKHQIYIFNNKFDDRFSKNDVLELERDLMHNLGNIRDPMLRFPFKNELRVTSNNPNIPNNQNRIKGQEYAISILGRLNDAIKEIKVKSDLYKSDCKPIKAYENVNIEEDTGEIIDCLLSQSVKSLDTERLMNIIYSLEQELDNDVNGLTRGIHIEDPNYKR